MLGRVKYTVLCKYCGHRMSDHRGASSLKRPLCKYCLSCECVRNYVMSKGGSHYELTDRC